MLFSERASMVMSASSFVYEHSVCLWLLSYFFHLIEKAKKILIKENTNRKPGFTNLRILKKNHFFFFFKKV